MSALQKFPSPLEGEGGTKCRMRGSRRRREPASGRHPSPQDGVDRTPSAILNCRWQFNPTFLSRKGRGRVGQICDLELS